MTSRVPIVDVHVKFNSYTGYPFRTENLDDRIARLRPDFIKLGYNFGLDPLAANVNDEKAENSKASSPSNSSSSLQTTDSYKRNLDALNVNPFFQDAIDNKPPTYGIDRLIKLHPETPKQQIKLERASFWGNGRSSTSTLTTAKCDKKPIDLTHVSTSSTQQPNRNGSSRHPSTNNKSHDLNLIVTQSSNFRERKYSESKPSMICTPSVANCSHTVYATSATIPSINELKRPADATTPGINVHSSAIVSATASSPAVPTKRIKLEYKHLFLFMNSFKSKIPIATFDEKHLRSIFRHLTEPNASLERESDRIKAYEELSKFCNLLWPNRRGIKKDDNITAKNINEFIEKDVYEFMLDKALNNLHLFEAHEVIFTKNRKPKDKKTN